MPFAADGTGPALFIDVTDQNITADEDANPVKTLRKRYDAMKKAGR